MYIEVNGIDMYYECIGEGNSIILLHGNTNSTGYMKFLGNKLKDKYKIYLIDRRCCGKSEKNCDLSYEETAKDIFEFIQKLNLDKPIIIGSSGGATVAMYIAINYPENVSKIVLCSGVARKNAVKIPAYAKFLDSFKWYPGKKDNDRFYNLVETSKDLTSDDLSKIQCETLVVNGSKDIVSVSEAEFLHQNIRNSELLILEKETHTSYLVRIKWMDKLNSFLEK